jgi:hypothetical protein
VTAVRTRAQSCGSLVAIKLRLGQISAINPTKIEWRAKAAVRREGMLLFVPAPGLNRELRDAPYAKRHHHRQRWDPTIRD